MTSQDCQQVVPKLFPHKHDVSHLVRAVNEDNWQTTQDARHHYPSFVIVVTNPYIAKYYKYIAQHRSMGLLPCNQYKIEVSEHTAHVDHVIGYIRQWDIEEAKLGVEFHCVVVTNVDLGVHAMYVGHL